MNSEQVVLSSTTKQDEGGLQHSGIVVLFFSSGLVDGAESLVLLFCSILVYNMLFYLFFFFFFFFFFYSTFTVLYNLYCSVQRLLLLIHLWCEDSVPNIHFLRVLFCPALLYLALLSFSLGTVDLVFYTLLRSTLLCVLHGISVRDRSS